MTCLSHRAVLLHLHHASMRRPVAAARGLARRQRPALRRVACAAQEAQVETITSLQNSLVKHCVKLRQSKKYRDEASTVVLSGADLIGELASAGVELRVLFVMDGAPAPDVRAQRVVHVPGPVMQKVSGLESVSAATLAAEVAIPSPANFFSGWERGELRRLLVLERLQDPGNLGTLLRTALALGWQGVLLLDMGPGNKCCDPFNDKALRAGRGAAFKLPMAEGSMQELRQILSAHRLACLAGTPHASGGPVAAAAGDGSSASKQQGAQGSLLSITGDDDVWEQWLFGEGAPARGEPARQAGRQELAAGQQAQAPGVALVLGSEGQGLSEEVLRMCTPVAIPMPGDMESLNVAVAGAILMFALTPGAPALQAALAALQGQRQGGPAAQRQQRQGAAGSGPGAGRQVRQQERQPRRMARG